MTAMGWHALRLFKHSTLRDSRGVLHTVKVSVASSVHFYVTYLQ